jgi:hypothetical protein
MYSPGSWEINFGLTEVCRIRSRVSATLRVYLFAQVLEKVALLPVVFDMMNCIRAMMSLATSSLPRVTTLSSIEHTQTGGTMPLFWALFAPELGDRHSREMKL